VTGDARRMKRSDRTSITSIALSLRATRIAKHSWVNSSSTLSIPIMGAVLDEVVGPDIIALLRRSRMHHPPASQSLPRLGCLGGTFSPSRRQIRSTRLSLIIQPACRNSSATLR
jgi:hypothetical protein